MTWIDQNLVHLVIVISHVHFVHIAEHPLIVSKNVGENPRKVNVSTVYNSAVDVVIRDVQEKSTLAQ